MGFLPKINSHKYRGPNATKEPTANVVLGNAQKSTGPLAGYTEYYQLNLVNFDWITWHTYEWENWVQVDALLQVAIGFLNIRGIWRADTEYIAGQSVFDPADTSALYLCLQNHTSGTDFEVDKPLYWELRESADPPVNSVFGRIGDIVAEERDYETFYASLQQSNRYNGTQIIQTPSSSPLRMAREAVDKTLTFGVGSDGYLSIQELTYNQQFVQSFGRLTSPGVALQEEYDIVTKSKADQRYVIQGVEGVEGRMRWRSPYIIGNEYLQNDVVFDDGWTMIANKDTFDRAAPQQDGNPDHDIGDSPVWSNNQYSGVVRSGAEWDTLEAVTVRSYDVWAPTLSADTNYVVWLYSHPTGDPDAVTWVQVAEPVLIEDGWATVSAPNTLIFKGTTFGIILDALNSGPTTNITGGWSRAANSNSALPAAQQWNRNNSDTIVRIHRTDLDSVDRFTELQTMGAGTSLTFTNTADASQSVTYTIQSTPTVSGDVVIYSVQQTDTGPAGEPPVSATTTMSADVPTPQPTDYVSSVGQPILSWGIRRGKLELDGVPQTGVDTNAYGVRVNVDTWTASPDWDVMSLSGSGVGGSSGTTRIEFINLAALENDTTLTYAGVIIGDIISTRTENYVYEVIPDTAMNAHVTTAGGVKLHVVPQEGQYQAEAFGSVHDAGTCQAAFNALTNEAVVRTLRFSATDWVIDQTCTLPDPHERHIDATGAKFTCTAEILMFDLNGRTDPTYTDNETRQNFSWKGGSFGCTIAEPTTATIFRALGFRKASITEIEVGLNNGGFAKGIVTGGKDTFHIENCKFFDTGVAIEFPPYSTIGGPLEFVMAGLHGSMGNGKQLVRSYVPLTDCVIRDCSCNMGSLASQIGIQIERFALYATDSVTGTFIQGETCTTSDGNTLVYQGTYEHFPFQLGGLTTWLYFSDRFPNEVGGGVTITGDQSGATMVTRTENTYRSQSRSMANFKIEGIMHWEAGSGADGATCVRYADMERRGTGATRASFDMGSCGVNGGGAIGLDLDGITYVDIKGRFAQTEGNGTSIRLSNRCSEINILPGTRLGESAIDLNGMDRVDLDMSTFDWRPRQAWPLIGWRPHIIDTGTYGEVFSNILIDMESAITNSVMPGTRFTQGGFPPLRYRLRLNLRANKTANTNNQYDRPRLRFDEYANNAADPIIVLAEQPIAQSSGYTQYYTMQFDIMADANGNLQFDGLLLPDSEMQAWLMLEEVMY